MTASSSHKGAHEGRGNGCITGSAVNEHAVLGAHFSACQKQLSSEVSRTVNGRKRCSCEQCVMCKCFVKSIYWSLYNPQTHTGKFLPSIGLAKRPV